jgi:hypothetical protein
LWEKWRVAVANQKWEHWLERLYNLPRDKRGSHERPHKPVLLLSIIDLLDHGTIKGNEVPLSEDLVRTFKRYFEVVRGSNDRPSIENPFYFLSGDKFWQVSPRSSREPMYREGYASAQWLAMRGLRGCSDNLVESPGVLVRCQPELFCEIAIAADSPVVELLCQRLPSA